MQDHDPNIIPKEDYYEVTVPAFNSNTNQQQQLDHEMDEEKKFDKTEDKGMLD